MATSKRRCAFEKEKLPSNPCIASAEARCGALGSQHRSRRHAEGFGGGTLDRTNGRQWIARVHPHHPTTLAPSGEPFRRDQGATFSCRAQKIFGAESVRLVGGGMEEEGEEYLGARALAPLLRSGNAVLCWHERSLACPHCPPQSAPALRAICATPSACLSAAARASRSDSWTTTSKASCAARTC